MISLKYLYIVSIFGTCKIIYKINFPAKHKSENPKQKLSIAYFKVAEQIFQNLFNLIFF